MFKSEPARKAVNFAHGALGSIWSKCPTAILATVFALELVIAFLLVWRPVAELALEPQTIQHESGHAYVVVLAGRLPFGYRLMGDDMTDPHRSDLRLFRDQLPIGNAHTPHAEIRRDGQGAYSHWRHALYFSTSGNTDPRTDGHLYSMNVTLALAPPIKGILYVALVLNAWVLIAILRTAPFAVMTQRALSYLVTAGTETLFFLQGFWGRLFALLIVLAVSAIAVTTTWQQYYITPDSHSYLPNQFTEPEAALRPPIVSTWLGLFSDLSLAKRRMDEVLDRKELNKPQTAQEDDPILPAIQAQRLFLLIAFVTLVFVAMNRMSSLGAIVGLGAAAIGVSFVSPSAVTVVLAVFGLFAVIPLVVLSCSPFTSTRASLLNATAYRQRKLLLVRTARIGAVLAISYLFSAPILTHSFLSEQQHFLMSEALAMSWQLLFAACALHFIWKRNGLALIGAGIFAALSYLTRSASVFLLLTLGLLLLLALIYDRRRLVGFVFGATTVTAILINAVPISWMIRGQAASTAPMLNWGPIAFAVEVAEPGDDRLLPDSDSKRFLAKVLDMRENVNSGRELTPAYRALNLGPDLYFVAYPAAKQSLSQVSPQSMSELFRKVAWPILTQRVEEYASIVGESLLVATGLHPNARTTRLFESPWHWVALFFLVALAFRGAERDVGIAMAATLLIGMHLTHVAIVSAFDVPIARYIYATEIFVVFAIVLLADYHIRVVLKAGLKDWFKVARRASVDDTNSARTSPNRGASVNEA